MYKVQFQLCAHEYVRLPRIGHDFKEADEDGGIPACIFELHNLRVLELANQAIRSVPPHIGKLQKLKYLNLSRCMQLTSVPGELGLLPNLDSKCTCTCTCTCRICKCLP